MWELFGGKGSGGNSAPSLPTARAERAAEVSTDTSADVMAALNLEMIGGTLPQFLYVYDRTNGRTLYENRSMAELMGYVPGTFDADQVLLRHPDDDPVCRANSLHRLLHREEQEEVATDYRVRHSNGDWHWLYHREVVLTRGSDGTPHLIVGIAEDTTQRLQSEEERRQQRLVAAQKLQTDTLFQGRQVLLAVNCPRRGGVLRAVLHAWGVTADLISDAGDGVRLLNSASATDYALAIIDIELLIPASLYDDDLGNDDAMMLLYRLRSNGKEMPVLLLAPEDYEEGRLPALLQGKSDVRLLRQQSGNASSRTEALRVEVSALMRVALGAPASPRLTGAVSGGGRA